MKIIYLLSLTAILYSCSKENTDIPVNPLDGLTKLKEGYVTGAAVKLEIWGEKNFSVGYNNLALVLYDSLNLTEKITDAHIHFMPVMTMKMGDMDMQQSTPVENPAEIATAGAYPCAITFVLPSNADYNWQLMVSVHNHQSGKEGEAVFDITVDNPDTSVLSVFASLISGDGILALSIVSPTSPEMGMNDIEFTIYREVNSMDWQPDDSYSIEILPEMPAMGHGSTDNINPVNKGNGHYRGKVNFSTMGEWKLNVLVKKGGIPASPNLLFMMTI